VWCHRRFFARPASASKVPLFTLFALVALPYGKAMISNNVKGGTGVVDAATRASL
jgi:hypothetical protein